MAFKSAIVNAKKEYEKKKKEEEELKNKLVYKTADSVVPIAPRNKDADNVTFTSALLGGISNFTGAGSFADKIISDFKNDPTLMAKAKEQGLDTSQLYTTQENLNMFGSDVKRTVEATGAGISSALSNLGKGVLIGARNMGALSSAVDKAINDLRAGTENAQVEELKSKAKEKGIDTITLDEYLDKAKNTKTSLELINDFSANTFDKWSNEANQRIAELQGETENDFAKKAIGFMPNLSQQAVTIGASLINPVLGTSVATGQAMGSYYNDAKSRGMTDEQANDFSQIMGIVEGATEMIGVDKLIKAGKGAKALAKGGLGSARKELSKEVITSTFGNLLSGSMDNFMQEALTEPIQEGVADWIGGKGNWENIDQRMLEAGINGAITSLITGGANIGVQSAVGVASKTRNGQQLTQQEVNQGLVDTLAEIDKLSKEEKQEFIDNYVTPGIETAQDVVKNELNQVPTEPNRAVPMGTSENAQQQVQEQEQQVISNQDENALNQNVEPQNLVESAEKSGIDVKDEKTRKNLEVIQKFNENRGVKATFDADAFKGHDNVNSFFRTDENGNREIVFNPNTMTDKTIEQLAVHEVYHDMVAGGTAQELTDFVVQKMSNNPEYQEYVRALQDVYEKQDSDIIKEEAVAHYLEKNLGTDEFISELQQRGDRTTIQRIIDTIKDMITKAKNTLTGKGDLNYLLDLQRKYEQAYRGEFKGTQEQTKLSKQVITDNQGRELSKGQQEFYKSEAPDFKDENGNLKTFYHGSKESFNIFNATNQKIYGNHNVNFLTDNQNVSKSYGGEQYEVYVKSEKPYVLDGDTNGTALEYSNTGRQELTDNRETIKTIRAKLEHGDNYYKKSVSKISQMILENKSNILSDAEINYLTEHPFSLAYLSVKAKDNFTPYSKSVMTNDVVNAVLSINDKIDNKYDAVLFKSIEDAGEIYDNNSFAKNDVVAVFEPNQIKNVDNTNPTENPDIRYQQQGQGTSQETIDNFLEKTKVNEGTGTAIKDLARVQEQPIETTEPIRQVAPSEAPTQVPQVNEVKQRQVENTQPTTQETISQPNEKMEMGQRKTYKTVAESINQPQEVRDIAQSLRETKLYQKKKNSQVLAQAQDRIKNVGADNLLVDLTEKVNNNARLSTEDTGALIELLDYYGKKGDTQRAETTLQNLAMSGTETAQALQIMRALNHMTPQGQAIWIQRSADKLNKSMLAKKKATLKTIDGQQRVIDKNGKDITNKTPLFKFTQEMQKKLQNSTKENMYDVLDGIYKEMGQQVPKTHMEQFDEWRYFSMLGNPKTHIRNILGNVTMEGLRQGKNKLAGAIEDAYYSVTGKEGERNHTLRFADKKTKDFAKQDVKNRDVQTMLGVTEDKYNPQSRLKQNQRTFKSNLFEKSIGKVFKGNTSLLSKEDAKLGIGNFGIAGLEPAYQRSLAEYITANRLDVDTMTDKQLARAREYAVTEAKEATFHTYNKIASLINTFESKNALTKVLVGGTVPFKQTPMNVAIQGFEYSPVGLLKTLTYDTAQLKNGNINANQYINKISKGLTGTGIALLGYALTSAGVLKASSGGDDKDDYEKSLGKQNYAIQIGDNTYSLDWLAPAGIPLFVGSELYQISKADAEEKKGGNVNQNEIAQSAENLFNAMTTAMNPMTEMTMLSGLTSVLKSYANDPAQALGNILINTGKSYATQSVPTALGQIVRSADDKERSTTSTESNVFTKALDTTKNQIMSKLPVLRQMLPVATDVWGNEIEGKNYIENAILPANRKEVKTDKVDEAITKLYDETGESSIIPDTYIQKTLTLDKEKYRLTNEEYAQLKQQYGQASHDLLEALTSSSDYDKLTNDQKVKAVKEVYSYVKAGLKHTYADQNDIDAEDSSVYQKVQSVIENGGDAKDYFKYVGLTNGMDKDAEKINALENSNIKNKGAIYESTIGKDDDKYKIMKNTGVNDKAYLDYKQQKFTADKDAYGKTISGSAKDKFYDYIDNANMTYEQKLLLTGMNYTLLPGERDTLANYIESLPISASEKTDIYRHLKGAKVYNNGEIYY